MSNNVSWYRWKPYPHFDLPLGEGFANAYVQNPENISRHSFYPLITYCISTIRFRKDPETKRIVKDPKTGKPIREVKPRRIAYPSHVDGYIYSYYKFVLEPFYNRWLMSEGLEDSVTAFRAIGENNVTLAKKAFAFVEKNPDSQIVATDITGFFDHINHQVLKTIWAKFLGQEQLPNDHYAVFKAVTRYRIIERQKLYEIFGVSNLKRLDRSKGPSRICTPKEFRERVIDGGLMNPVDDREVGMGIPQGTSLSPLLSNMYMADMDLALCRWITFLGGRYWRYCDDILVVLPNDCGADISDIKAYLDWWLNRLKLCRSEDKTQVRSGRELPHSQLQYLGFLFNGKKIMVRSSSIHRYDRKVKKAIQAAIFRQIMEIKRGTREAPFRKRAIYNMYSELPLRGTKIKSRKKNQKYRGNFTHYMEKSAKAMDSLTIRLQRNRLLKRLRARVGKYPKGRKIANIS